MTSHSAILNLCTVFPWFTAQPVPRNGEGDSQSVQGPPWPREEEPPSLVQPPAPCCAQPLTLTYRRGGTSGQLFWGVSTFLFLQTGTQVPLCVFHTHLHMSIPTSPLHLCNLTTVSQLHTVFFYVLTSTRYACDSPVHSDLCIQCRWQRPHPRRLTHTCRVLASSTPGSAPRRIYCHSMILQKLEEDDWCLWCCLATFILWSAWQLHCAHVHECVCPLEPGCRFRSCELLLRALLALNFVPLGSWSGIPHSTPLSMASPS